MSEQIVMRDSPEAAQYRTVKGAGRDHPSKESPKWLKRIEENQA